MRHRALCPVLIAAALFVVAAGCPRRETPTGLEQAGGPTQVTVTMAGSVFYPPRLSAPAGQEIRFVNNCTLTHTVTADSTDPPGGPDSDRDMPNGIQPGQTYVWSVPADADEGAVWYYHCRFHGTSGNGTGPGSGMTGAITVGPLGTSGPQPGPRDSGGGTMNYGANESGAGAAGTSRSTGAGTAGTNKQPVPPNTTGY